MVASGGRHAWLLSGGHAWLLPGSGCGCSCRACVVAPRGCVVAPGGCMVALEGAWLLWGGMHGFFWGACMVAPGGVCGFFRGVACMVFPGGGVHRIQRDTVNERAVRILLECILVNLKIRLTRLGLSFQK